MTGARNGAEQVVFVVTDGTAVDEGALKTEVRIPSNSLMAEWLEQVSQWHEMCCHDQEVMSSSPSRVELGVLSTSVKSRT